MSLRFHADFYLCTMFSFIPFHVPEDVLFRPFLWLFYQFLYSLTIWFPLNFSLNSNYFNEKEYPFFKMPSRSRSGIAPEIAARSRSKACHDPVTNHAGNPHGNTTGSHKITPESRTDPVRIPYGSRTGTCQDTAVNHAGVPRKNTPGPRTGTYLDPAVNHAGIPHRNTPGSRQKSRRNPVRERKQAGIPSKMSPACRVLTCLNDQGSPLTFSH